MAEEYWGPYWGPAYYLYQAANPNNYTAADRPYSHEIDKIVVHVTQGSWSSAMNWFSDPLAQASAHYTVRSHDGYIGQSVDEDDIAWHAGNWYYNQTSIGIEHEGYVDNPVWFTEAMYDSSSWLAGYLCAAYGIPVDRAHIIGHDEVPNPYLPGSLGGAGGHTDPGYYWDWDKYIDYTSYYADLIYNSY